MRQTILAVGVALFFSIASAGDEAPPGDLAAAVSRLAAAMERLTAAVDKQASSAEADRDGERVQVAVGILGLRSRRVDRLEGEIRQLGNEGDDIKRQMGEVGRLLEDVNARLRQGGPDANLTERQHQVDAERALSLLEARIGVVEERKAAVQAELDAELRKLSHLEAILDDWLKQQGR